MLLNLLMVTLSDRPMILMKSLKMDIRELGMVLNARLQR